MTQDDIITMAREAGGYDSRIYPDNLVMDAHDLERFAALVAAKERERIALEFDRRAEPESGFYEPEEPAEIVRGMGEP